MVSDRGSIALAVIFVTTSVSIVAAQGFPSRSSVDDRWPDQPRTTQAAPLQPAQRSSGSSANSGSAVSTNSSAAAGTEPPAKPRAATTAVSTANAVACSGVFAKDSTHLKLAIKYDSRNIVFGEVDGPDGSKINATILFPNDPRRRLEVLWNNEASRSDVSVIAINGKSQWVAPRGVKLGLAVGFLEKINGRSFKVSGFDAGGSAAVLGWEGGALSSLPGGCKIGIRLTADSKASPEARSRAPAEKEYMSNTVDILAAKPIVGEILIGY